MRSALVLPLLLATRLLIAQNPTDLDPRITFVTTGGAWRIGASHGYIRLIVLDPGAASDGPRLVIQWIERDGARIAVRDSRAVTAIGAPWALGPPRFGRSSAWIRATVTGADSAGHRTATWLIAAGPPGQYSVSVQR